MTDKKKAFSNDNTKKGLGYDYQKLIALEYCLNSKPNENIWLECYGDVSSKIDTVEIKHHIDNHNLTSNSTDVWKTLKNYAVEYESVADYENLILHSTSSILEDSIFYDWNNNSSKLKYSKLKSHLPAETIKDFKVKFFEIEEEKALKILSRFKIYSDEPKISEKWLNLKDHATFTVIRETLKEGALVSCYGYITKKAIENSNLWQININDFKSDIRYIIQNFVDNGIPFPVVNKSDISETELQKRQFIFIDKIKKIGLKNQDQALAVEDFMKANLSAEKLLRISPPICDNLDLYDNNVERSLIDGKRSNSYDLTKEDLNLAKANIASRKTYFDLIKQEPNQIIGVRDTQKYYRNGRIHQTLEISNISLEYLESEL